MAPKFFARRDGTLQTNGSTSYLTPGPWASLAKVANCPCEDGRRRTVYVTGQPDTFFSAPAQTRVKGKTVTGYLTTIHDGGYEFRANAFGKNADLLKKATA